MDELTNLWDRLSLTTKGDDRVDLNGSQGLAGELLATKFLTKQVLKIEVVMRMFKPL